MAVLRVQSWIVKHTDPESTVSAAGETGIGGRPIEDKMKKLILLKLQFETEMAPINLFVKH